MSTLSQEQWDSYKSQFPNDQKLQALTLEELFKNTDGGKVDWESLKDEEGATGVEAAPVSVSPCQLAMGYVVFDLICLVLSAVAVRASLTAARAARMAEAAAPVVSKLGTYVAMISAEGASKTDIATGVFNILKTIYSGGCIGAVLSAFLGSLNWITAALYAATALATIAAAIATGGAALIAQIVLLLATAGFLVVDSAKAVEACR